jgi:hypothetical protein
MSTDGISGFEPLGSATTVPNLFLLNRIHVSSIIDFTVLVSASTFVVCCLFNDALSSSDYITSNHSMINE